MWIVYYLKCSLRDSWLKFSPISSTISATKNINFVIDITGNVVNSLKKTQVFLYKKIKDKRNQRLQHCARNAFFTSPIASLVSLDHVIFQVAMELTSSIYKTFEFSFASVMNDI